MQVIAIHTYGDRIAKIPCGALLENSNERSWQKSVSELTHLQDIPLALFRLDLFRKAMYMHKRHLDLILSRKVWLLRQRRIRPCICVEEFECGSRKVHDEMRDMSR